MMTTMEEDQEQMFLMVQQEVGYSTMSTRMTATLQP